MRKLGVLFLLLLAGVVIGAPVHRVPDRLYVAPDPFPTGGLISYYTFDDNANDSFGSNDFAEVGTPSYSTNAIRGKSVGGFSSTIYLRQSTSDTFNFTDGTNDEPFTISMWLKDTVLGATILFTKRESEFQWAIVRPNPDSTAIRLSLFGASNASIGLITDTETGLFSTSDDWGNITISYDGSGTSTGINIYKDGVEVSTSSSSSYGSYSSMPVTSARASIGNRGDGGNLYDRGNFDEVAIWGRVLSSNEVYTIGNTNNPIFYTP